MQNFSSVGGVLFNRELSALITYPAGKPGPYVVPNSVTNIGNYAFSGCTRLESVTIGNSVISVGQSAFSYCMSLASVTVENSVTYINIGSRAFYGCTSLASVYFAGYPPIVDSSPFDSPFYGDPFVTVFHRSGNFGWGSTFAGRPTALWIPLPPYADWAASTGLTAQYPAASSEADDPDGDGLPNRAEWLAGTDPTQPASRLELESVPRPADLAELDRTPISPGNHAVYFRSVPGRYYGVQRASSLTGTWELQGTRVASATQTRFVLENPNQPQVFYRVLVLP